MTLYIINHILNDSNTLMVSIVVTKGPFMSHYKPLLKGTIGTRAPIATRSHKETRRVTVCMTPSQSKVHTHDYNYIKHAKIITIKTYLHVLRFHRGNSLCSHIGLVFSWGLYGRKTRFTTGVSCYSNWWRHSAARTLPIELQITHNSMHTLLTITCT